MPLFGLLHHHDLSTSDIQVFLLREIQSSEKTSGAVPRFKRDKRMYGEDGALMAKIEALSLLQPWLENQEQKFR